MMSIFKRSKDVPTPAEDKYMAPHCDPYILHAPGECETCDHFPHYQRAREMWDINFTGHHDPAKAPCPAEVRRDIERINRWPNNRPTPYSPA